jgi:signal peptidase I
VNVDATAVITDLLARGHGVRFRAGGDSMHPIIRSDDYLHVEPAAARPIRRGDVVLTLAPRGLTAHRVIRVSPDTIVTRGDNAPLDDGPLAREHLLGIVTHTERAGQRLPIRRATSVLLTLQRLWTAAAKPPLS